jgi:hypothetical protein
MGPNPQTGAKGEYQFTPESRESIMRHFPSSDPWSHNKQVRDKAALAWIDLYGKEQGVNILGAIQRGNFQLADRVLGRNQFTSLPRGAEQHVMWRNSTNYYRYGPVGKGAPMLASAQQQCAQTPGGGFTQGSAKAAGPINQRLRQAAARSYGMDSSAGPRGGREACVWAVNRVLENAGLQPFSTDHVPTAQKQMQAGRGTRINLSQAKAGDIILAKGYEHIGICQNDGCTHTLSNSSSRASFAWKSDGRFQGEYDDSAYLNEAPTEEVWRLNK